MRIKSGIKSFLFIYLFFLITFFVPPVIAGHNLPALDGTSRNSTADTQCGTIGGGVSDCDFLTQHPDPLNYQLWDTNMQTLMWTGSDGPRSIRIDYCLGVFSNALFCYTVANVNNVAANVQGFNFPGAITLANGNPQNVDFNHWAQVHVRAENISTFTDVYGRGRRVWASDISAPASANVGQSFDVSWTAKNAGWMRLRYSGPISCNIGSGQEIGTNDPDFPSPSPPINCAGTGAGRADFELEACGPGSYNSSRGDLYTCISETRSVDIVAGPPPPPPPPPPGSFNLSVSKSGGGSGVVSGPGINCGADCSETYNQGALVTLSATVDSGSTFGGWSGCDLVSGTSCTLAMNQSRSVTATFHTSGGGGGCQGDCAQYIPPQNVPTAAGTGQSFPVSVTMKNIGTTTWTGADQYKLGSQNPENNSTWGLIRVNVPTTVSPGQEITFNFNPTAPASPGNYNFQWRMLREGVQWFGDFTPNVVINVTSGPPPPPPGSCTDNSTTTFTNPIPGTLNPEQSVSFTVRVTDTGDTRWYHGNAYQFLQQSNLSISPSYGRLPRGVYPGDQVDWTFTLTAPSSPGTYTLNMRMIHNAGAEYIKPDGTTCPAPSSDTYFGQTATRTFNVSQPSPTTSDVVVTLPNYCVSGPAATVGWSYSDSSGRPQSAYQVQIDEQPSFSSPEIDSGKVICQNCRSYFSGTGILQFNTTYGVRARTWNNFDVQSAWQEATSCIGEGCQSNGKWKTPSHAYPNTNSPYQFTWSPANPAANQQVQFTDRTLFDSSSNNKAWSWTFVPAGGGPGSSTAQNPVYTFNSEGVYQVTEKARDNALPPGQYCTGPTQAVNSQKPIPIWKEIAPR